MSECLSCGEGIPPKECPKSKRPCGHHCNCSWVHDCCHWCGAEMEEIDGEGVLIVPEQFDVNADPSPCMVPA